MGPASNSLAEGPIVLKWKGATENGVFTLRPSSETEGAITEVLNGKQPGYTFKYQGKGRYRIEVVEENPDGSPWLSGRRLCHQGQGEAVCRWELHHVDRSPEARP